MTDPRSEVLGINAKIIRTIFNTNFGEFYELHEFIF
jgi:hypothetical protein